MLQYTDVELSAKLNINSNCTPIGIITDAVHLFF